MAACANVLGRERRYRREHGRRDQEQKADDLFHDAHARRGDKAPAVRNDRDDNKGDLHKTVLHGNGQPHLDDAGQHPRTEAEILPGKRNAETFFVQHDQREHYADRLGQDGAQRRACRAHLHGTDEDHIQHNVDDACRRNEIHRAFGIAEAAEDTADHIVSRDEGASQKADHQIAAGLLHGLRRGGQNRDDAVRRIEQHHCPHYRHRGEQEHGVPDGTGRQCFIPGTHCPTDHDRGSHGHADHHHRDHVCDLAADGYRRDRGRSVELSGNKQIRQTVKCLQETGKQIRPGKQEQIVQHVALGQIPLHLYPTAFS